MKPDAGAIVDLVLGQEQAAAPARGALFLPAAAARRELVRAALTDGAVWTTNQVADRCDLSYSTARQALQELGDEGAAKKVLAPAGSHYPWLGWRRVT